MMRHDCEFVGLDWRRRMTRGSVLIYSADGDAALNSNNIADRCPLHALVILL
jgi:hypothetical protein